MIIFTTILWLWLLPLGLVLEFLSSAQAKRCQRCRELGWLCRLGGSQQAPVTQQSLFVDRLEDAPCY